MVNKSGSIADLPVWAIMAFVVGVICVMMVFISQITYDSLIENAPSVQKSLSTNYTEAVNTGFLPVVSSFAVLKWGGAAIIIGMILSILVGNFLVRTHPVFLVAYILIWVLMIVLSAPLSNVYETLRDTPAFANTFSGFWMQNYIFENFPVWVTVVGALGAIALFVNWRTGLEGGGGAF